MVRKFLFIFFIAAPLLTAQVNNLNEQIQLAQTYARAGQLDKAERLYKALLAAQPRNNLLVERLNEIYLQTKNYDASISLLKERIKEYPQDITAYGQLGGTYHIMDSTEKAFEIWNEAIEMRPDSPSSYRVISHFMIERRALDEGIEFLKSGRERIGKPELFAYDLATIYTTMMKYREAAEEYCTILLYQPDQLETVNARIRGYIFRSEALDITINAVKDFSDENNSHVLFNLLSFLYTSAGDYESAFVYILNSLSDDESGDKSLLDFGEEALSRKQYSAAAKAYKILVDKYEDSPKSAKARIGLARTLEMEQEDYSDSTQTWKPIKIINFSNQDYLQKIIEQYIFITKNIDNPEIVSEAYCRMGIIFNEKLNKPDIADSLFQLVLTNPFSAEHIQMALLQIGKIRITQDLIEEASLYFERATQLNGRSTNSKAEAYYLLLKSKFWLNEFNKTEIVFADLFKDLKTDHANDAIELSVIINTLKSDSVGLSSYAKADLLTVQGKFGDAARLYKSLFENNPGTILGEFSKFKYSQILIAQDELPLADILLNEVADSKLTNILSDKALYLQAQIYQYGIKDNLKAINIYEKLLANFPNSLYLDKARENIIILKPIY